MRNLRVSRFEDVAIKNSLPLTGTAWNTSDDSIIYAFGPTPIQPTIELKKSVRSKQTDDSNGQLARSELVSITSWDAPCPLPDLPCDEILLVHHFPDTATTCVILAGGDLILVREDPEPDQEAIEIVGSIDVGIAAAAWAADEEVLAIVTRTDSLVLMSRTLEPLTEITMTAEDLQASRHVSVGWGKKETQFQGKRAKAMRDPTMPEQTEEGQLSRFEDGAVSISWRGDGAFLAVNSVVPDHRRVIRVFSREGALDSVSEPVNGLESALSWKPSGNLIASIKRSAVDTDNPKLEVIFFEKNGLRHGQFPLRLQAAETKQTASRIRLSWNIDSTVLAICFLNSVQFWTMSNYHYYLKQDLPMFRHSQNQPITIKWHPEKALKYTLAITDKVLSMEYNTQVTRGSTVSPYDFGIVPAIDGKVLKLTPLKHVGIPPPMSFCEVDTGSNIVDCATSQNGQRLAVLTQSAVLLYDWRMRSISKTPNYEELRHTTNFRQFSIPLEDILSETSDNTHCTQLVFNKNNEVYALFPACHDSRARCCWIKLVDGECEQWDRDKVVIDIGSIEVPVFAQNLLVDVTQNSVWIQDDDSTKLLSGDSNMSHWQVPNFAGNQPNTSIFSITLSSAMVSAPESPEYHQTYLTPKGALYVDGRLLARDCTSFVVSNMHLIFTTAQHLLKFVHLTSPEAMEVPGDTPEVDERCRSVERGAKIVTVIPSIYAVILQMPRGNLETIYPRVLVVSGIRSCLQALDYRTAFVACQDHQVDMNIIFDHMPETFLANTTKFCEDLKKPARIDEFLSKLKAEDVTQTLYKDTLKAAGDSIPNSIHVNGTTSSSTVKSTQNPNKVNQICDALISVLTLRPSKYLQCIITAHVCKQPPDLTAALILVSSLRATSTEEADLAISHLCFLTDTNRLYDAALSLYDLELTLLVAQNAQRDPREYMPFLQGLQALPILRRQYQIDNHLRNYSKALVSLHALEVHDEVEAYTLKHILYTNAMDLYKYDQRHLPRITALYAEYLESQSQYSSAAILYESLSDYVSAYPLYALAHQWRESLSCASLVPLESSKLQSHAASLAVTCAEESRDYRSAATINIEYLSNIHTAARLLCKGSYFAEATRILALHNLSTSIPSTIDGGLSDKFSEIIELIADCKSQLSAQIPRILELRLKKAEDPLAFYGGDATAMAADGFDIPDNISLAGTDASTVGGQSLFTRYGSSASKFGGTVASNASRKTSKTKRREERKRARGKKGSVYEEEYLVSSVARLIERVNGVQDEVKRLVSGLLRRGMREQSAQVDEVMREITVSCENARKEVWMIPDVVSSREEEEGNAESTYDINGEGRPSGADGVFWDSVQEISGVAKKQAPEVKSWAGGPLVLR